MPRAIIRLDEEGERLKEYLVMHPDAESILRVGSYFVVNHTGNDEEFQLFRKAVENLFMVQVFRELCHGKCRDDSDCLNTAKQGKYCYRHVEKSP